MANTKLTEAFQNYATQFRRTARIYPALMGRPDGTVNVPERDRYVYVQMPDGSIAEAFNASGNVGAGTKILVGYDDLNPRLFQVLGLQAAYGGGAPARAAMAAHHASHEMLNPDGGDDPVFSNIRQWTPARVGPGTGLTVQIYNGAVWDTTAGAWKDISTTVDLTAHVPADAGMACWVLFESDADGNIQHSVGAEKPFTALSLADIPAPTAARRAECAVRLFNGQTDFQETRNRQDFIDMRYPGWHGHSLATSVSPGFMPENPLLIAHGGTSGSTAAQAIANLLPAYVAGRVLSNDGSVLQWITSGSSGSSAGLSFDSIPVGAIAPFGSVTPPTGWLSCNGGEFADADYPELAALLGTTFGAGSAGHTVLPDLRGRFPLGDSAGHAIGTIGGAETHTQSIAEMPSHSHDIQALKSGGSNIGQPDDRIGDNTYDTNWQNRTDYSGAVLASGSGSPMGIMPPYQAMHYIIKAIAPAMISATQIGQVPFSIDGTSFTARTPLTDNGWLVDEISGVLLVVDTP